MRISDWSSAVCSSDLETEASTSPIVQALRRGNLPLFELLFSELTHLRTPQLQRIVYGGRGEDLAIVCRAVGVDKLLFGSVYMLTAHLRGGSVEDEPAGRERVGEGKSWFVRVSPGGRQYIKKK